MSAHAAGATLTLTGANFADTGEIAVLFTGATQTQQVSGTWQSASAITCTVPAWPTAEVLTVSLAMNGQSRLATTQQLTVTAGADNTAIIVGASVSGALIVMGLVAGVLLYRSRICAGRNRRGSAVVAPLTPHMALASLPTVPLNANRPEVTGSSTATDSDLGSETVWRVPADDVGVPLMLNPMAYRWSVWIPETQEMPLAYECGFTRRSVTPRHLPTPRVDLSTLPDSRPSSEAEPFDRISLQLRHRESGGSRSSSSFHLVVSSPKPV